MTDYTKFKRGSEWRKWDLHIHTPETKKNDRFEGNTPEEKWNRYIEAINSSSADISVVGVTDYFCIENYFKFKQLVTEDRITKKFDLILPNIEIRVVPVTGTSTPVNLHCIFNPEIDEEIENRFLAKLKFSFGGSDYSAKKEELIRLGKSLPGNANIDATAALKAGISQYVVGMDTLRSIFEKDTKLRENTVIVVSNSSNDGASGIRNHANFFIGENQSQLDATRWSIYQFSDAIFSSNSNDILYFTGNGVDSTVTIIEKCGTRMPCFHGCDAHSNDKVFRPEGNRLCWIKADPTFEGLKQTLYEPEDRVKIQTFKPDIKSERYVISQLQFKNSNNLFGNQNILLSENLNAIIGGKSSGKSLLLYSSAKSIDPEQVSKAAKRLNFEGYQFDSSFDFEVTWKNDEKDILSNLDPTNKTHKITYIPQLYINYLVEKNNKEELNTLLKNILLQDADFKQVYDEKIEQISNLNTEVERLLNNYLQIKTRGNELLQRSKDIGKSESIKKGIEGIQGTVAAGQTASNLSQQEFDAYTGLLEQKSDVEKRMADVLNKKTVLARVLNEVETNKETLLGDENDINGIYLKGSIDRILDELTDLTDDVNNIRTKLSQDYDALIENLKQGISNLKIDENQKAIKSESTKLNQQLMPILRKIEGQKELQKLTQRLETEKQKLNESLNLERQIQGLRSDHDNIRKQIAVHLESRYQLYKDIVEHINANKQQITPDILLKPKLIYKRENFPLFDQINKVAISNEHYFKELFIDDFVNYDLVPSFFSNNLRIKDDKLIATEDLSFPLKQKVDIESILRGLIYDKFEFDYSVTYKGDDLLNMSPGKKGTVLLILFLQISSSEYPILIDQPEDNLDNRTIYDLLCKMIKQKKKERQIIIVSHNANLVVATDTENIIVANQEGQGTELPVGRTRFEYVNGSLEHSFVNSTQNGSVLTAQGIKQHVCDILEGGNEAFKQRERKYAIK